MKKTLLKWAIIFHAIMYSVSLLYVGYQYGEGSLLLRSVVVQPGNPGTFLHLMVPHHLCEVPVAM